MSADIYLCPHIVTYVIHLLKIIVSKTCGKNCLVACKFLMLTAKDFISVEVDILSVIILYVDLYLYSHNDFRLELRLKSKNRDEKI